jgi:curved DNA-binding protein CbpA
MDIIVIDNEQYDPYHILGVTKDDDDESIKMAFKRRAKKYHPDKATTKSDKKKYEKRFMIIVESYDYIKKKRTTYKTKKKDEYKKQEYDSSDTYSEKDDPNNFGYGDYNRLSNIDDYDVNEYKYVNQFKDKKFTNKTFNKIFEYNKKQYEKTIDKEKANKTALIHKTTDGFYGYNTADLSNCASVSSYNGLMLTGDRFGENGIGYWNNVYGDYKLSFQGCRNPNDIIQLMNEKDEDIEKEKEETRDYKKYVKQYNDTNKPTIKTTFNEQQKVLYDNTLKSLVDKEKEDKEFIMKYAKKYNKSLLQQAIKGELDTSPNLIYALNEHYNTKRIQ